MVLDEMTLGLHNISGGTGMALLSTMIAKLNVLERYERQAHRRRHRALQAFLES